MRWWRRWRVASGRIALTERGVLWTQDSRRQRIRRFGLAALLPGVRRVVEFPDEVWLPREEIMRWLEAGAPTREEWVAMRRGDQR